MTCQKCLQTENPSHPIEIHLILSSNIQEEGHQDHFQEGLSLSLILVMHSISLLLELDLIQGLIPDRILRSIQYPMKNLNWELCQVMRSLLMRKSFQMKN